MLKFKSVDDYLSAVSASDRLVLSKLRVLFRKAVPGGVEVISYGMPAIKLGGRVVVYYAVFKNHYSVFIPDYQSFFDGLKRDFEGFSTSKGGIKFVKGKSIPFDALVKLVERKVELLV